MKYQVINYFGMEYVQKTKFQFLRGVARHVSKSKGVKTFLRPTLLLAAELFDNPDGERVLTIPQYKKLLKLRKYRPHQSYESRIKKTLDYAVHATMNERKVNWKSF
jgi:hypothetical protein